MLEELLLFRSHFIEFNRLTDFDKDFAALQREKLQYKMFLTVHLYEYVT